MTEKQTYLLTAIERLPDMLKEASALAGFPMNSIYTYYEPSAPNKSWTIFEASFRTEAGRGTNTYKVSHDITLRALLAPVDSGLRGNYPNLTWTFSPTIVAYFAQRRNLVYMEGQSQPPYLFPLDTRITTGTNFLESPGGGGATLGIEYTLSLSFALNFQPEFDNV